MADETTRGPEEVHPADDWSEARKEADALRAQANELTAQAAELHARANEIEAKGELDGADAAEVAPSWEDSVASSDSSSYEAPLEDPA